MLDRVRSLCWRTAARFMRGHVVHAVRACHRVSSKNQLRPVPPGGIYPA
jgi:hypothetical protein